VCNSADKAKAELKIILFWLSVGMFSVSGVFLTGIAVHFIMWLRWRRGILAKIENAAVFTQLESTLANNNVTQNQSRRNSTMSTYSQPLSIFSTPMGSPMAGGSPLNMMGPDMIYMTGAPKTQIPLQTGTLRRGDKFEGESEA
jgi:hypothetical protein